MQLPPFTPVVRATLIVLGVVFAAQLAVAAGMGFEPARYDATVLAWAAVSLDTVLAGHVWTILTYAALHSVDDIGHLLFNALGLWWFGAPLEAMLGRRRMIRALILGALAGGVAVVVADALVPGQGARVVGASGAINTLVACLLWRWRDRWLSFFVRLRGWQWLALFTLIDVVRASTSNVSLAAHLGGLAAGIALAHFGVPGGQNPARRAWLKFKLWRTRRHLRAIRGGRDEGGGTPLH